jgi:hypothetical protein
LGARVKGLAVTCGAGGRFNEHLRAALAAPPRAARFAFSPEGAARLYGVLQGLCREAAPLSAAQARDELLALRRERGLLDRSAAGTPGQADRIREGGS